MKRVKTHVRLAAGAIGLLALSVAGHTQSAGVTVFEGARLIVGDGRPPIENATFVVGSDQHVCAHQEMPMDQTKTPMPVHFDRCEPPVMAFRNTGQAASFVGEHGGAVQTLAQLVSSLGAPTAPQKGK